MIDQPLYQSCDDLTNVTCAGHHQVKPTKTAAISEAEWAAFPLAFISVLHEKSNWENPTDREHLVTLCSNSTDKDIDVPEVDEDEAVQQFQNLVTHYLIRSRCYTEQNWEVMGARAGQ